MLSIADNLKCAFAGGLVRNFQRTSNSNRGKKTPYQAMPKLAKKR
jgi:hypothetical protein